jgi:hypothetical protein
MGIDPVIPLVGNGVHDRREESYEKTMQASRVGFWDSGTGNSPWWHERQKVCHFCSPVLYLLYTVNWH